MFSFKQILLDFNISFIYVYLFKYQIYLIFCILLDMITGNIITQLRDKSGFSQSELADKSGVSRVMIGKYERGEAIPSIDAAKKIADALEVSLDYLVGNTSQTAFDKRTLERIEALENLEENKKQTLYDLIDTYIRDSKTRKAYSL